MAAAMYGMCSKKIPLIFTNLQKTASLTHRIVHTRCLSCNKVLDNANNLRTLQPLVSLNRKTSRTNVNRRSFYGLNPLLSPTVYYSTTKTQQQKETDSFTKDILKSKKEEHLQKRGEREEEKSKKEQSDHGKKESWFSAKHAWKLGLASLGISGLLLGGQAMLTWGAPAKDSEGNEIIDEFSHLPKWRAYLKRTIKEFNFFKTMIQEPSSRKLLPDPLKEPYYQPPYTLVLEMTGVLVHPDWTLGTGWRFKKRPAVDHFLQQVGPPLFEVIVYTKEQGMTAFPIIDGLDSQGYISYRLFRDATRYQNGHHIKDLSCLNRDLSKVIIIDCDVNAFELHPRNGVALRKWTGADDDRTLLDLASFLRTVATSGVDDVRTVLDYYNQFDDPLKAFKENQQRLQEEQERSAKMSAEAKEKKGLASSWASTLSGRRR